MSQGTAAVTQVPRHAQTIVFGATAMAAGHADLLSASWVLEVTPPILSCEPSKVSESACRCLNVGSDSRLTPGYSGKPPRFHSRPPKTPFLISPLPISQPSCRSHRRDQRQCTPIRLRFRLLPRSESGPACPRTGVRLQPPPQCTPPSLNPGVLRAPRLLLGMGTDTAA